ncbi:MAG: WbqC family protein [Bacteroidales bacterium]|nr:WbqC family protein [Bacteroidales bacterium]
MSVLAKYGAAIIEQHETFPKQTFRNRTTIATGNGLMMLNVPVSRPSGNHTTTAEMVVSYHEPWNIRHWRAIASAYNAAPYFLYYKDELDEILMHRYDHLLHLNEALLHYLLKKLKITCQLEYSQTFIRETESYIDLRDSLTAKRDNPDNTYPHYSQVFENRHGFLPNLSVIDLLFNLGPEAKSYLLSIQ